MTASTTARTERSRTSRLAAFAAAVGCALHAHAAVGDEKSDMCLADSIEGQVLKNHGRLTRALEHLERCAEAACEEGMRARCALWRDEVRASTPLLTIRAVDDRDQPLPEATVRIDGAIVDPARPLPVDPGPHEIRAEHSGRRFVATIEPRPGSQEVKARIDLRSTVAARPTPTLVYVLGGVAATGFLAFGAFGVATLAQVGNLDACKPYCDASSKPTLTLTEVGADVSLGVGLAAALGATIAYLVRPVVPKEIRLAASGIAVAF